MEDQDYVPSDEEFNENDVLYSEELTGLAENVSEDEMDLDAGEADEVEDDAILKLVGHAADKDVFAIAISKSAKWFASGGEDDTAAVWNIQSDNQDPVFRVSGHSDSVHCVDFNTSGSLLATGDMSGKIIVTDVESNVARCEIDQCDDLEWIFWHSQADILFAGAKDGLVWMWLIGKSGVVQSKNFVGSSAAACVAGRLLLDAKRLLAVYADGQICIWNVKDGTAQSLPVPDQCTVLDIHPDANTHLAAVGLESGRTVLVNTETAKEVAMLGTSTPTDQGEEGDESEEVKTNVEVVSFCKEFPWLAAGTSSGVVHIYDYERSVLRHALDHGGNAVVRFFWKAHNNELYLFVACFDGAIRIWNAKSGTPHKVIEGAGVGIYDLCLVSKDDQEFISTACGQGTIRFFECSP